MVKVTGKKPRATSAETENRGDEKLSALLLEMDALHAVLRTVDQGVDEQEALRLTSLAFEAQRASKTLETQLVLGSMARILGKPFEATSQEPSKRPWERYVFESLAQAWIYWAANPTSKTPLEIVSRLRSERDNRKKGYNGAVHLHALYFWADAVEALAKKDAKEARRLWQRSIEVGSSFGTASNASILWSYAATYFPEVIPRETAEGLKAGSG